MTATLEDILAAARAGQPVVMGVLNVTPDSFWDGGRFQVPADAAEQARRLAREGAHVIDVGAESTRPGSARVSPDEQIARLRDVLPAAVATGAVVSVDTTSAQVARWALDAGASLLNDISAGRDDADLLPLAGRRGTPVVLMHMRGEPKTMQQAPYYEDVVRQVRDFLARRIAAAAAAGVDRGRIWIDPGIGFGKRLQDNLDLLAHLDVLGELGCPVLIGVSRKAFLGQITGRQDPSERLAGTLAACLAARRHGAAVFRVHDVAPLVDALAVCDAIDRRRTGNALQTKPCKGR